MSQHSKRSIMSIITTFILLFVFTLATNNVHAADGYFNFTGVVSSQCSTSTNEVTANYTIDQFFPAGQRVDVLISSYGLDSMVFTEDRIYSGEVGLQTFPLMTTTESSGDIVFEKDTVTFTTIIYAGPDYTDSVFYLSSMTLSCVGKSDGQPASATIKNNDVSGGSAFSLGAIFFDGRINTDLAAPAVLYQPFSLQQERDEITGEVTSETAIVLEVYAVDPETSEGVSAVQVDIFDIVDNAAIIDRNVLLAEGTNPFTGMPIKVYWLINGNFQVNTYYADGKPYSFIYDLVNTETTYLER